MKVDFKKQNVCTFENFMSPRDSPRLVFSCPQAKLCVQDAGRTPKKITVSVPLHIRFAELRKKLFEQPHLRNIYIYVIEILKLEIY